MRIDSSPGVVPSPAQWLRGRRKSVIQELLPVMGQPDVLSFALGLPDAGLFPIAEIQEAADRVLTSGSRVLQYAPPDECLKHHIVELMRLRGVACGPQHIFLTAGAQQAMQLVARLLLDARSCVMLEHHVYSGFRQVLEPFQPDIASVATDLDAGMSVEAVERELLRGRRPALLYTVTDGHNPLGTSLAAERRRRLVELARAYGMPILEDDAYGFLHYVDQPIPPMRALDDDWVFYAGSFSKILAPALRVGWIVASPSVMDALSILKEANDLDTSPLSQRIVAAYLERHGIATRLERLRHEYRRRRDAMIEALREHFPEGTRWHVPSHGMFVWVSLPAGVSGLDLLQTALTVERIAFVPGEAFLASTADPSTADPAPPGIRLNFASVPLARLDDGIARLGALVARAIAAAPRRSDAAAGESTPILHEA